MARILVFLKASERSGPATHTLVVTSSRSLKKANHKSTVTPTTELDTIRPGASFCARVLFRDGPDQGHVRANVKLKETKKGDQQMDHNSNGTTPLDTNNWGTRWLVRPGASFCARVLFRDGPDQGHVRANVENSKKAIKGESLNLACYSLARMLVFLKARSLRFAHSPLPCCRTPSSSPSRELQRALLLPKFGSPRSSEFLSAAWRAAR